MTLQQRLAALIGGMKLETKSLRSMISGANNGDASGLTTNATNVVSAINEIKIIADNASSGGTVINDSVTNTTDAWSSAKIKSEITTDLAAALEGEDLSDLAAAVAANAAADLNLVTLASFNTLSATVANKANSSDVYTQAELGDPDTDLLAIWNAA